ncbi:GIY-YIG nuclease family protein [Piscibacillus salipiscarius]|uniref:GIY-YIG nuclease family protein n=1 Tax=Piscibacillus salipiscarius TaxID=299480 RepID=A0ABW5QEB0_9BACI|nr:GIY-YIG nuclease family protein [Piscibacillus salipiscarius]
MLRCCDQSLYTGYTNNLDNRLAKHLAGKASKYTRARLPVKIVYYEVFETKSEAMSREANIKKLPKKTKEEMIQSFNLDIVK